MMLEKLAARRVHFQPATDFANINTRADLDELASRLERKGALAGRRKPRLRRYHR
jgi:hypothetical protein